MSITNNVKKELTLNNQIKLDDIVVCGQTATINSDNPEDMSISAWTNDKQLYKENRTEIRKLQAQFEDAAFAEQDILIAEQTEEITE